MKLKTLLQMSLEIGKSPPGPDRTQGIEDIEILLPGICATGL